MGWHLERNAPWRGRGACPAGREKNQQGFQPTWPQPLLRNQCPGPQPTLWGSSDRAEATGATLTVLHVRSGLGKVEKEAERTSGRRRPAWLPHADPNPAVLARGAGHPCPVLETGDAGWSAREGVATRAGLQAFG